MILKPPLAAVASDARRVCWQGADAMSYWLSNERRQRRQRAWMASRSRRRAVVSG